MPNVLTRQRYRSPCCVILPIVLCAIGCGDESTTNTTTVQSFREFQHAVDSARCAAILACCSQDEIVVRYPWEPSESACIAAFDAEYDNDWGWIDAGIADGTLTFDEQVAAACAAAFEKYWSACTVVLDSNELFKQCAYIVNGVLPTGAECDVDNNRCNRGSCVVTSGSKGVCTRFSAAGESCDSASCSPDLVCLPDQTCGLRLAPGQTCTMSEQCASQDCSQSICQKNTTHADLCEPLF